MALLGLQSAKNLHVFQQVIAFERVTFFTHHPKKVTAAESPGIGFLVVFSRYLDNWHTLGNRRLTLFGVFLFNPGPKGEAQKILVRLEKYLHF